MIFKLLVSTWILHEVNSATYHDISIIFSCRADNIQAIF